MNILIVSHGVPSKEDPQWGCFELDQARALCALGHSVSIAAVDGRFRRNGSRIGFRHKDFAGIDACVFFLFPIRLLRIVKLRIWIRDFLMLLLFRHMVRRHGLPDVIYAHFFFTMSQLELVRRHYPEVPIVGIEHAARIIKRDVFKKGDIIQFERAYRNVDKLLSVSPALQNALYKKFGVCSDVLYDMVGEEFLEGTIRPKSHSPFRFVTTGSLEERKAIDLIVKAMADIDDKSSELYVIGDGPERDKITSLALSLGVSNRVHLMGKCNKEQIIELYEKCDAFVLVSRAETFCVVNIEAMAMGLPVISTRCGGPEYYIDESKGILLNVDDYAGLVKAMNSMASEIGRYKAEELRGFVRSHYSGEVIARQAESFLQAAVEQKKNKK